MSPKKSFLERMGLIEPAKPAIEVGKKNQNDGEKRVLADVKLKRQPAEPMARSTEGQPVSQNVVELEKLRKEMETAVSDYNQKSAQIHEGRDTSFDNDISKMRKSVVDERYEDGVLDPTPQFNFDEPESSEMPTGENASSDDPGKPKFFFQDASLEDQVDRLLGLNKESKIESHSEISTEERADSDVETIAPSDVLEEIVQEASASPFNEFTEQSQVPTQPQDTFSLLGKLEEGVSVPESDDITSVNEKEQAKTEASLHLYQEAESPEELKPSDVLEELVQESAASPFNEFALQSQQPALEPEVEIHSEVEHETEVLDEQLNDNLEDQQNLLYLNQASIQTKQSDHKSDSHAASEKGERYKEEFEEQIQERIHEQIEEKFEKFREDKQGLKEELKKELELEWKKEIKEELRQQLKKDIKEEVIQDVAQDVNQFKDEIANKVVVQQEQINQTIEAKIEQSKQHEMKSDWEEELSGKTSKPDMHAQYMDDQFVEVSEDEAVIEVVEPALDDQDDYVDDLMKEYQEGFEPEYDTPEVYQAMNVEDVQERGRSNKTMERNRMSEEATNSPKYEDTEVRNNLINVKQEFTSTAASAFKPDLHIGEKLDLIIGQYEKNKLQSIEDIYKNSRMETDTKKTIFMADVFLKAIPANLPQDVKRETVLNILKISGIELDSLLGDAYQRIDSLNKVLEDTISTSNEIFKRNEDTIHELERRIQDLNEINVNRAKFQEDQNTMVEHEIQKIINLVEFVKPKTR